VCLVNVNENAFFNAIGSNAERGKGGQGDSESSSWKCTKAAQTPPGTCQCHKLVEV